MSGFSRGGNFKADVPHKTIVFEVPERDIDSLRTLISAYSEDLPPRLRAFMLMIDQKLEKSNGD